MEKYFCASFGDFIQFDEKPNEDCYLVSEKLPIFAVADGVTQSHFLGGKYAYPDGAKKAAQIFCQETVKNLEENWDFNKAFEKANAKIKELNIEYGIDKKMNFVEHDWFDTVGIAGFVKDDVLHYGFAGDCGLIILDKQGKVKFQTKDQVAPAVQRFNQEYQGQTLTLTERTRIIHQNFRNNPDGKGYGSFSGEEGVKYYYNLGQQKLEEGDLVVFYTDGIANFLPDPEFINLLKEKDMDKLDRYFLAKSKEDAQKYGDDKTFVSFVF